jgi:LysM repeat protein
MFLKIVGKKLIIAPLIIFVMVLTSCSTEHTSTPVQVTETISLIQYSTPTPSQIPETLSSTVEAPTQQPTPTPTPMIYTIVEGDTMLAIAFRHGISLEELQNANPDINARLLIVGTELIIPPGEIISSNPATATPIPIQMRKTKCYLVPDGIWCFVTIKNDRSRPLENISARVLLLDNSGDSIGEGTAIGAINLLPVDEELPLVVFIPGRFPSEFSTDAKVLTGHPVPRNDNRYLNAWLEIDQVEISQSGRSAEVFGKIGLPVKSEPGNLVWILVIAYDREGNVIGIRKAEQLEILDPGSSQEFNLEVFSLESEINEVKAFVEVRP